MPRPLFYLLLFTLLVLWAKRFVRRGPSVRAGGSGGGSARARATPGSMPDTLVCGACGAHYDPQATGWICPKCHK